MPGLKVAIIGCGGAGRTMAAGLKLNGADVLLVNRSVKRAHQATQLLHLPFRLLSEFSPRDFDLVINATPLGRHPDEIPFDLTELPSNTAVIDLTYSKTMTALVKHCLLHGNKIASGRRILMHQVMEQFRLLSGKAMPYQLAYKLSGLNEEKELLVKITTNQSYKKQNYDRIQKFQRERSSS